MHRRSLFQQGGRRDGSERRLLDVLDLDNDSAFDTWVVAGSQTIAIAATSCSETGGYPSGAPANSYNDVACP